MFTRRTWSTWSRINVSPSWRRIVNTFKIHWRNGTYRHRDNGGKCPCDILSSFTIAWLPSPSNQISRSGKAGVISLRFPHLCMVPRLRTLHSQCLLMNQGVNIEGWIERPAWSLSWWLQGVILSVKTSCPVPPLFTVAWKPDVGAWMHLIKGNISFLTTHSHGVNIRVCLR